MINLNENKSLFIIKNNNYLLLLIKKNNNISFNDNIYINYILNNVENSIVDIINDNDMFNKLKLIFYNNNIIIKKYIKY